MMRYTEKNRSERQGRTILFRGPQKAAAAEEIVVNFAQFHEVTPLFLCDHYLVLRYFFLQTSFYHYWQAHVILQNENLTLLVMIWRNVQNTQE